MHLCGGDCIVRSAARSATSADLEYQSEDVDTFYEMLTARIQNIDTSLNPHVKGSRHSAGSEREIRRCKRLFRSREFPKRLFKMSPELQVLKRLYVSSGNRSESVSVEGTPQLFLVTGI